MSKSTWHIIKFCTNVRDYHSFSINRKSDLRKRKANEDGEASGILRDARNFDARLHQC